MDVTMKIKCFIDTYRKKQISFATLVTILDEIGSTLEASKEVIRALLHILLEKQNEAENISQSKETQTEEVTLDELEVTDDITNVDFEHDTEELPDDIMKVEDEDETSLVQEDDNISSFEANDIDEDEGDDDEASSMDMKPKRARLECLICVKTFRYRVQLNKHMKSHDVDGRIIESNKMNKNGGEITTKEQSIDLLKIPKESISKSVSDPFFTSKWVTKKNAENNDGKWVTTFIANPYQFGYHSTRETDGVLRFRCVGCKLKKKDTFALAKWMGNDPVTGQPIHKLLQKDDLHACTPAQSTKGLNKVFLNRCYEAIREKPLARLPQVYKDVLQAMKVEFFSQEPADAEITKTLQLEFEHNLRSFRNIQGCLYKYRCQFVPKQDKGKLIFHST